jgi:transposase
MPIKPGVASRPIGAMPRTLRGGSGRASWRASGFPILLTRRSAIIRTRAEAADSVKRSKQQLLSFLLRHGRTFAGRRVWTRSHFTWLAEQKFEHPAHHIVCQDYISAILAGQQRQKQLEKLILDLLPSWPMKPVVDVLCVIRGIIIVAATSILSATGDLRRFLSL